MFVWDRNLHHMQSSIKKAKRNNYHDGPVNSLKGEENILEYTRERQKQLPSRTLGSIPVVLCVFCSLDFLTFFELLNKSIARLEGKQQKKHLTKIKLLGINQYRQDIETFIQNFIGIFFSRN